jgi:hypothetical protein
MPEVCLEVNVELVGPKSSGNDWRAIGGRSRGARVNNALRDLREANLSWVDQVGRDRTACARRLLREGNQREVNHAHGSSPLDVDNLLEGLYR